MIYHRPSKTLIVIPHKTGSQSLRGMLTMGELSKEFSNLSGPLLWDLTEIGSHCQGDMIKRVHGDTLERKLLLFRNPVRRVISMWKFIKFQRDGKFMDFGPWLRNCPNSQSNIGQRGFLKKHDGIIRTERLVRDIYHHFKIKVSEQRRNVTPIDNPVLTVDDWYWLYLTYWEDLLLWKAINHAEGVCRDKYIDATAPSDEAKGVFRDLEPLWY